MGTIIIPSFLREYLLVNIARDFNFGNSEQWLSFLDVINLLANCWPIYMYYIPTHNWQSAGIKLTVLNRPKIDPWQTLIAENNKWTSFNPPCLYTKTGLFHPAHSSKLEKGKNHPKMYEETHHHRWARGQMPYRLAGDLSSSDTAGGIHSMSFSFWASCWLVAINKNIFPVVLLYDLQTGN